MRTRTRTTGAVRRSIMLGVLAASAGLATNALAGVAAPAEGVKEVRVSYADLDLDRPEGMETLMIRVQDAARAVCGARGARPVRTRAEWRACYSNAVEGALAQLNAHPERHSVLIR